jgi:hypothetical protein
MLKTPYPKNHKNKRNRSFMPAFLVRATACIFIALNIWPIAAMSEEDWTLRRQDVELDVTVHDRSTPDGYREFRGVTHVQSRLSAFVALLHDSARMPEWLYRAERVETIEEVSATENYSYAVISLPWPFRDRDSIVHAVMKQDPVTQELTLRATAVPDYLPSVKGYIRMPLIESMWRFTPLADGRTRVEFSGYADPGGKLSSGLLATFQSKLIWQSPYNTLRNLHKVIAAPRYQAAEYAYIEEPRIWAAVPP